MPKFSPNPDFMDKYNLHKLPEVDESVEKLRNEGEKIPETKESRINAHWRRIERALENKRGLFTHLVKENLENEYTINLQNEDGSEDREKIDKLVIGLFESEKEILRRRGMGAELEQYGDRPTDEDYEKYRQQIYAKKAEQRKTLDNWVDYLGGEEANFYPTWFKYLALRSLQKMGKRDRDTEDYSKRSSNTLQPFPDLSREALALTLDAMKEKNEGEVAEIEPDQESEAEQKIAELVERGDFAKLYAHFQGEIERARREKGESTAGEWRHWPSGSDAREICKTLEGKGTEWCTAGVDVARSQLQRGEFYIYYTYDQNTKPADPRVAIYLIDGQISEVRGVYGKDQDLELDFVDIAKEKYKEFPGSEKYEKKDHDMKYLSLIENKVKTHQELGKEELIFLYEIDSKIEGFGHGADPRVAELRATRNPKEDAPIVLECASDEIAWSQAEISDQTKSYIGPLFQGIFRLDLEHIYTTFPETEVSRDNLTMGGETAQGLQSKLNELCQRTNDKSEINITGSVQDKLNEIYKTPRFAELIENPEQITTVRLKVRDLGFTSNPTTDQIYARSQELGLELCPDELGPYQRLKDKDQPMNTWYSIAMKQFTDRRGFPDVFGLGHNDDGLWLNHVWTGPTDEWNLDNELIFRLPQVS